jgi:hypothetical protein
MCQINLVSIEASRKKKRLRQRAPLASGTIREQLSRSVAATSRLQNGISVNILQGP